MNQEWGNTVKEVATAATRMGSASLSVFSQLRGVDTHQALKLQTDAPHKVIEVLGHHGTSLGQRTAQSEGDHKPPTIQGERAIQQAQHPHFST
jgi:hypothetical protein